MVVVMIVVGTVLHGSSRPRLYSDGIQCRRDCGGRCCGIGGDIIRRGS